MSFILKLGAVNQVQVKGAVSRCGWGQGTVSVLDLPLLGQVSLHCCFEPVVFQTLKLILVWNHSWKFFLFLFLLLTSQKAAEALAVHLSTWCWSPAPLLIRLIRHLGSNRWGQQLGHTVETEAVIPGAETNFTDYVLLVKYFENNRWQALCVQIILLLEVAC